MSSKINKDTWNSRLGIILAVAGSAVGLGNFLRFPGQAAAYGGAGFMLAYFLAFLLLGLPLCWADWIVGRYAGQRGFHSLSGVFNLIWRHPLAKYCGVLGAVIPVVMYMYYVCIEAWCLGYAVNFLQGDLNFNTIDESKAFWASFVGLGNNGDALNSIGLKGVLVYLLLAFSLNFVLVYRGISRGIEFFCKLALPTLVVLGFIILIRVLTLGAPVPDKPADTVNNGLGFMWNPTKVYLESQVSEGGAWDREQEYVDAAQIEALQVRIDAGEMPGYRLYHMTLLQQLANPELWLAAAGQVFFSLSVGFGVIITYASYLKKGEDVVLSGLSASSANGFCEVILGGLITLPAAVAFIGLTGLAAAGLGTFDLGFKVLPLVFSKMMWGPFFGFLWFFLLFLAAMTSSLSQLQPGIAFFEETLKIERHRSVALLGLITAIGCSFVVYFSADAKALDTLDFWISTFMVFVLATISMVLFSGVFGVDRGFQESREGAIIQIPKFYKPIMKWVSPLLLLTVFVCWLLTNVFGISLTQQEVELSVYIQDLFITPNPVAWMCIALILALFIFFSLIVSRVRRYKDVS